ncbi:MAG: hypothetical protein PHV74_02550 [Dehalococcoidia bacterium]|nr:hypothetical protein [Dehalococcoidia bacterium]
MEQFDDMLSEIAKNKWQETEVKEIVGKLKGKGKLNREEILAMRPGRELNIVVAKIVMGHEVISDKLFNDMERFTDNEGDSVWGVLQHYSEDIAAATTVVTLMMERGYLDAGIWDRYGKGAFTPAEAICKRALLASSGIKE